MPTTTQPASAPAGVVVIAGTDEARVEVHRQGAHVTSWIPAHGTERLFLSSRSLFEPGAAIRGGVPVIFPQFASEGPLPKHGFARAALWELIEARASTASAATATLRLRSSPTTTAIWPHEFDAELSVTVRDELLELALMVANTGVAPFTFTAALHTYLRVADARQTYVRGLAGRCYRDSTGGGVRRTESLERLPIDGEVNRIYLDVDAPLVVEEPERVMRVEMDGFRDVVVWNPGPAVAATLSDLEPDGYLRMLCIEAATVDAPITIEPGESWRGSQRLIAG